MEEKLCFSSSTDNNNRCICKWLGENQSACQGNAINGRRISTVPLIILISEAQIPREDENQISTSLVS